MNMSRPGGLVLCLAGILAIQITNTSLGDETMIKRAQQLMSALKVEEGSETKLPDHAAEAFSDKAFRSVEGYHVKRRRGLADASGKAVWDFDFVDGTGVMKAFGRVSSAESTKAARLGLFQHLVMNSMPFELLVSLFEVDRHGPGDLCIVRKRFDTTKSTDVLDPSELHFVRGNVVVSLYSGDASADVAVLAKAIEKNIVGLSPRE